MQAVDILHHVLREELRSGGRGQGKGEGDFGALGFEAFVAVADCEEPDGVWGRNGSEVFGTLDEVYGGGGDA